MGGAIVRITDEFLWGVVVGAIVGAGIVGCAAVACGQEDGPTPRNAVGWAAEHLAMQSNREDWRYILADPWVESDWSAAISIALNTAINREAIPYRPQVLANGWMLAVDFSKLVSDEHERARVLKIYDGLALDEPYFHVPRRVSGISVPVVAAHLDPEQVTLLVQWSDQAARHGVVPIYRAGWAISQMLSAHEGAFYQLRGTPGAMGVPCDRCAGKGWVRIHRTGEVQPCGQCEQSGRRPGQTDEDAWLDKWGLSTRESASRLADRRKAQFDSGVLGDVARGVVALRGFVGSGWASEDSIGLDPDKHPIYSLEPGEDGKQPKDAGELIVEMPNSLHDFLLVDGKGKTVTLAVLNGEAVRDTTVPAPYRPLLQPAISCIRCHWTKDMQSGDERVPIAGLHPMRNDVTTILDKRGGVDILGDDKTLARIAGLYAGYHEFDQSLQLGRMRLGIGVRQCTEGLDPQRPQGLSVQEAGMAVMGLYGRYRYRKVTPADALADLTGTVVEDQEAPARLAQILGGVDQNPDASLIGLMRGLPIRVQDWERVFGDAYLQAVSREETNQ